MKQIPLTQGKFALVDDADYDYLMQWKWYYTKQQYAARGVHSKMVKGVRTTKIISMHRFMMDAPNGMDVDHRDLDRLNNQRSNLRICTHKENCRNQEKRRSSKTNFKGVSIYRNKFVAHIKVDGRKIHLGYFVDIHKAAESYNDAARKYFGEFALLNKT